MKYKKIIDNLKFKGNLPNVVIMHGKSKDEISKAATYLSMSIKCSENYPCKICSECTSIINKHCIDLIEIDNGEKIIKREYIEKIISEYSQSSTTINGKRVSIIRNAHNLNKSSSNIMLKFLEEISQEDYVIFTTTNKGALLDTIISRSVQIEINATDITGSTCELPDNIKLAFDNKDISLAYMLCNKDKDLINILLRLIFKQSIKNNDVFRSETALKCIRMQKSNVNIFGILSEL